MPLFRVNFLIGANVEAQDETAAFTAAKHALEQRYGSGIVVAIEEQAAAPVIYRVELSLK